MRKRCAAASSSLLGMCGVRKRRAAASSSLFGDVGVRSLHSKIINLLSYLKPKPLTLVKKVNEYHLSRKKTHPHK
jgi:hypothetical protein